MWRPRLQVVEGRPLRAPLPELARREGEAEGDVGVAGARAGGALPREERLDRLDAVGGARRVPSRSGAP